MVVSKGVVLADAEISSKNSCPAVLPWQNKATIFDIPGPQKPERGHIRQNRPFKKPPFVPLELRKAQWELSGSEYHVKALVGKKHAGAPNLCRSSAELRCTFLHPVYGLG